MKTLNKTLFLTVISTLFLYHPAWADQHNPGSFSFLAVLIEVLILATFLGGLFFSFKVYLSLKGGELSTSWQIVSLGFLLLALSQIAIIFLDVQSISISPVYVSLGKLLSLGFLVLGMYLVKKCLG